jgi:hypothetical protein
MESSSLRTQNRGDHYISISVIITDGTELYVQSLFCLLEKESSRLLKKLLS